MSTTTSEPLPEYADTIACCGDPQPVIDELTEWLEAQTAPQIQPEEQDVAEPEPAEQDALAQGETNEGAEDD